MQNPPRIAVVILNWNGISFLQKFLPIVVKYSAPFAKVIVADNASEDDSVNWLKQHHPEVALIVMQSNTGFAGGYNRALKQIEADFFVLLNSDVEVTEHWLEPVIMQFNADKNLAACQPKILDYNRKDFFEHAGAAGGFIDYLGYPFCRGRIYNVLEKDNGQYNDSREIFWATGACLFVRADVFMRLGGFDEEFFAHMEEIDLCWRIHRAGLKVMIEPSSRIYHVGAGTLKKSNPVKTYLNFRNNLLMIHKNLSPSMLWLVILIRLILDGIAGIKFLLDGNAKDCWSVIKAHFYFYTNFRKRSRIRWETNKELDNYNVPCIYPKSIVIDHYIKGIKSFDKLNF